MNVELDPKKASVLYIETTGKLTGNSNPEESKIAITGTKKEMLFNLAALVSTICDKTGIPAAIIAISLPTLVDSYRGVRTDGIEVDLGRAFRGGKP